MNRHKLNVKNEGWLLCKVNGLMKLVEIDVGASTSRDPHNLDRIYLLLLCYKVKVACKYNLT